MSEKPPLPSFPALFAFGDSLSDAGNLSLLSAASGAPTPVSPYFQETYSAPGGIAVTGTVFSNGPTWVQLLNQALGLGTLAPSIFPVNGRDFAYGGAETGPTPQNGSDAKTLAVSVPSQILQFQTADPSPPAGALYTLSIGANDVLDILADPTLPAAQQTADIQAAVSNEISDIDDLVRDGARDVLVMNVPDLGKTPEVTDGRVDGSNTPSPARDSLASALAAEYNADLDAGLRGIAAEDAGTRFYVLDAYRLLDAAVANPAAFGLANVTTPVWSGNYSDPTSGTLAATGSAQNQYLFWDHIHPTETGQAALATLAEQTLAAGPQIPCFAAGTGLAAAEGVVTVEHVAPGMMLRTRRGLAPVRWVGRRAVDCARHPRPEDVWPVRIRRGAFGNDRPWRDLLLSPDHAVFVDGALIPVRYLCNGATIAQEARARVEYWHVELPEHDVLEAEGLPCESYLDTGNRAAFNGGPALMLHADFARAVWARAGCAPLVLGGDALIAARRRLLAEAARLGYLLDRRPDPCLLADGEALRPAFIQFPWYRFVLRRRVRELAIVSPSAAPAEVSANGTDRRRLGLMVSRLALFRPFAWQDVPLASLPAASGWHAPEQADARRWRWTDGFARVALPPECRRDGVLLLDLCIAAQQPHWRRQDAAPQPSRRACAS